MVVAVAVGGGIVFQLSFVLAIAAGTKHKPSSGSFAAAVERQCKGVDLKCAAADATNFP